MGWCFCFCFALLMQVKKLLKNMWRPSSRMKKLQSGIQNYSCLSSFFLFFSNWKKKNIYIDCFNSRLLHHGHQRQIPCTHFREKSPSAWNALEYFLKQKDGLPWSIETVYQHETKILLLIKFTDKIPWNFHSKDTCSKRVNGFMSQHLKSKWASPCLSISSFPHYGIDRKR